MIDIKPLMIHGIAIAIVCRLLIPKQKKIKHPNTYQSFADISKIGLTEKSDNQ